MNTYESAREAVVQRAMNHWGRFRVTGKDAAALLHHLTTNDIKKLKVGEGCDAALVTSKGRLLDLLSVWRDAEGYTVLTSPNRRAQFAPHARSFVLFRQEIHIEDVSERGNWLGLFGPRAAEVLRERGLEVPEGNAVAYNEPMTVARTQRLPGGGFFVWSPEELSFDAPQCDNETFNILRVEDGIPVAGLELTDAHNPWEANLGQTISLHKGCYNGQEIIARLNTYQKVKQRLTGVKLQSVLDVPAPLGCEGREVGTITSSVLSPRFGPIGLAYVRGAHEIGATLQTGEQTAQVAALPFV
jgi:aminomethyltransferase